VLALIIAEPGPLRDGLQAMLSSIPAVESIKLADSVSTALNMRDDDPPDLVLLDGSSFNNKTPSVIADIAAYWPNTKCMILVDDIPHARELAGAGNIVVKGLPAAELFVKIEGLLIN